MTALRTSVALACLTLAPLRVHAGPPTSDPTAAPAAGPTETATPARLVEPPRVPPPPSGNGLFAGGITLVISGGLAAVGGGLLFLVANRVEGDPDFSPDAARNARISGGVFLGVGALEIGGGVGMIVPGVRRRDRLRQWELEQRIDAPADGHGYIVVGSLLLGSGGLRLISEAVLTAGFDQPVDTFGIVGGALQVVGGTASLAVGLVRRKRFRSWKTQRGFTAQPYGGPLRGGASFGVAGRF